MSSRPKPRDDLQALEGYHSAQIEVPVRLNTNESPYPPPAEFVAEWLRALETAPHHRYPDRDAGALKTALAGHLGQPAARVFPANGSNEVLQTILLTYGGHGRRALLFEPTYALHSHLARITATEVIEGERDETFAIDLESAAELIARERPAVVFVCSPNNPTGTMERREVVTALVDLAARSGAVLVVDEAYGEFAAWSAVELVDDAVPLVVVRTYSKVWSLAAVRLGFGIGPEWLVAELDKVVLPYHLSLPTQLAGRLALEYRDEMDRRVASLIEERGRLFAALQSDSFDGVTVFPSGANFLLFRVRGDGGAVWKALLSRGVLVRDFSRWPRLDECLRVTVGTPAENDAFLAALRGALQEVL
ncbi:MAG: histidinol-phosphate aminotransferase [Actinomycetota bacterium]|nr:histidinol-phosphate aminotransferase [Actinomycetota bacterium]